LTSNNVVKPSSQGGMEIRKRPLKLEPLERMNNNNDALQNILYVSRRKIGFSNFNVEICNDQEKNFNIIASNVDRYDIKKLVMSDTEGMKLVERFEDNYEKLIDCIRFKGDKIIIQEEEVAPPVKIAEKIIMNAYDKNLDKDNDLVEIPSDNQGESDTSAILHNEDDDDEEKKELENLGFLSKSQDGTEGDSNNYGELEMPIGQQKSLKPSHLMIPLIGEEGLRHISENEEEYEPDLSSNVRGTEAVKVKVNAKVHEQVRSDNNEQGGKAQIHEEHYESKEHDGGEHGQDSYEIEK